MLATCLLSAALGLAQAQTGQLEISNPRATYGHLGATRPKGGGILPGDVAHFAFDVKNLKHDAQGRASYSIAIEVRDSKGDIAFEQQPHNAVAQNFFGGNSMPATASMEIPLDAKPGEYAWKVTIHDRLADKSATISGKGNILPPDFGLIRIGTYADAASRIPAPPVGVVGETLYLSFASVGFARKNGQPDIAVKMRILDEKGQPTTPQPLTGHIRKDIPESLQIIPLQFALSMNRAGRYTVELTGRCELCKKEVTVRLPLRIAPME